MVGFKLERHQKRDIQAVRIQLVCCCSCLVKTKAVELNKFSFLHLPGTFIKTNCHSRKCNLLSEKWSHARRSTGSTKVDQVTGTGHFRLYEERSAIHPVAGCVLGVFFYRESCVFSMLIQLTCSPAASPSLCCHFQWLVF